METLLDVASQTGVLTGAWFSVPRDGRTHAPVSVQITVGTATVELEGRINSDDDAAILLKGTMTATEGLLVAIFPQMRARLSAATGATVRVSIGAQVR